MTAPRPVYTKAPNTIGQNSVWPLIRDEAEAVGSGCGTRSVTVRPDKRLAVVFCFCLQP